MLRSLALPAILTAIYYYLTEGFQSNLRYLGAFLALVLTQVLFCRAYTGETPEMLSSAVDVLGLDADTMMSSGSKCYSKEYHVVDTQYGDKAILAGYNENVKAHCRGAEGKYEHPMEIGGQPECNLVGYEEKSL